MRLLVLCQDPDGPVARHRVRALLPHLRDAGFHDVALRAIPKRRAARRELFREAAAADVTLLLRKLFTVLDLGALRRAAPRLAFDVDDAVLYRDPFRGRPRSRVRAARFRKTVRATDLVLAGNAYLHACVEEHGATAEHVVLAPTPIDVARYVPGPATAALPRRIGWIGSRSTRPYLRVVAEPLARLLAEHDDVVFTVMADAPPDLPLKVDFTPWSQSAEVPWLQSLTAGLMPLTDDPWSRGKCGFKLLQYMACGVPAVASPVGANIDIAEGGEAALLAEGNGAWHAALASVLRDDATARALATRGRATVERRFATDVLGPPYAEALASLARRAEP